MTAAACFNSDEDESDRWSIISDMLRFLRIGFLSRNEAEVDKWLPPADGVLPEAWISLATWRGPYSHVTSQSFSLGRSAGEMRQVLQHLPIQLFRRDGAQIATRLGPCAPGSIFETRGIIIPATLGHDVSPGGPDVLLGPVVGQIVDMASGLSARRAVVLGMLNGLRRARSGHAGRLFAVGL